MIFDGMEFEEIVKTVDAINERQEYLEDKCGVTVFLFVVVRGGNCLILIGDYPLWDNETGREWLDDDTQESLLTCLQRELDDIYLAIQKLSEAAKDLLASEKGGIDVSDN